MSDNGQNAKRKLEGPSADRSSKRRKGGQKHRDPKAGGRVIIESGDSGVFVTCDMGKENKCIAEALDLFSSKVEITESSAEAETAPDEEEEDIEAQIKKEVEGLQPKSSASRLFQPIKLDIPCMVFIRVDKSIDPVKLVHDLCAEAKAHPEKKQCRWVRRMTPVSLIRKTLSVELSEFAKTVLGPHFHSGGGSKKFAIRPTVTSNNKFSRDSIIKTVASVVGREHSVDLKNYDLLIIVLVIQNVIGMSVVGSDYDDLKRYNLAELYRPAPKASAAPASE
ncbi:hypothetical protein VTN49DRAFT_5385 [Thermomyces lanuginosus]|uniref:uncharacterized protein n=1 Tax=Thermomyces lanuginosus TaxID=5541 RepID=UPI003744A120